MSDYFRGSNGNLFVDRGGFRYCIYRVDDAYTVARNGEDVATAGSETGAKMWIESTTGDSRAPREST